MCRINKILRKNRKIHILDNLNPEMLDSELMIFIDRKLSISKDLVIHLKELGYISQLTPSFEEFPKKDFQREYQLHLFLCDIKKIYPEKKILFITNTFYEYFSFEKFNYKAYSLIKIDSKYISAEKLANKLVDSLRNKDNYFGNCICFAI